MVKDKWINIRCTEQERQDITEQAKQHDMTVAEFFRYLVAKDMKGKSDYLNSVEALVNLAKD